MTHVIERRGQVAAFFDLDGTLIPGPSLEQRLFRKLRHQRAIPAQNYFFWLAHALRRMPLGIATIAHLNKMYLRGVSVASVSITEITEHQAAVLQPSSLQAGVPAIFPAAIERVAWHVRQGHAIVLVSGTLATLAREAALVLALRLALRGLTTSIAVCATQLEEVHRRCTGRIAGEAIFAQGKARAIWSLSNQARFDLARSFAYGDSANDRWMLGAVGRPAAVNPSKELERIARLLDWPVLRWNEARSEPRDASGSAAIATAQQEILG
jgi:HAD superfamily hydrolase (TIGR01490 family)